ncbi:hypothetical protein HDU96_008775 [Phlyctochytrium bullatum]|nr:hypothetical protein HDU96_008775 [Phlyctochytrium bullatum]
MEQLFLGGNRLSGPIPASLGNLVNMTQMFLERNALSGLIPIELGNLKKLESFASATPSSGPLASSTPTLSTATDGRVFTLPPAAPPKDSPSVPIAAIAGGASGSVVFIFIIVITVFIYRKRQAKNEANVRDAVVEGGATPVLPPSTPAPMPSMANNNFAYAAQPVGPAAPLAPGTASAPYPSGKDPMYYNLYNQEVQLQAQFPSGSPSEPQSQFPSVDQKKSDSGAMYGVFYDSRMQQAGYLGPMNSGSAGKQDFLANKPQGEKDLVAPARGASFIRPGVTAPSLASEALSDGARVEMQARARVAAWSPEEVAGNLERFGVASPLVLTLKNNYIDGARLLALTDADLMSMGVQEWQLRDLVLRTVASFVQTEIERLQAGATGVGPLPRYTQ